MSRWCTEPASDVTLEVHTGVSTDTVMPPVLAGHAQGAAAAGAVTPAAAEPWIGEQGVRAYAGRLFLAAATRP